MTLTELLSLIIRRPRRDPAAVRVADLALGQVGDPTHFLVYLSFECDLSFELQADAARLLYQKSQSIGHLAFVTRRPDLYPAGYATIRFGTPLSHTRDEFPPNGAAAISTGGWRQLFWDRYQQRDIWIDLTKNAGTAESMALAALHEIAHELGWDYSHIPTEYSPEWWALCQAGAIDAAAKVAKWRTT